MWYLLLSRFKNIDMYAIVYPNTAEEYSNIILRPYHPALKTRKMPSVCEPSLCFVCCPLSTQHLPFFGSDVHIFLFLQTLAFSIFIVSMLVCWCQRVAQRTTVPQYTQENSKQQATCGLVVN